MILQLDPMIPVNTEKGRGYAFLVVDYSQEHDALWVIACNETGEIWWLPNDKVRFDKNISMQRYDSTRLPEGTA
jgi:hypothetical protein